MRQWTTEERKKQSMLIQRWKPWNKSRGPKTTDGKERSKMNARKHGMRSIEAQEMQKMFHALLREMG